MYKPSKEYCQIFLPLNPIHFVVVVCFFTVLLFSWISFYAILRSGRKFHGNITHCSFSLSLYTYSISCNPTYRVSKTTFTILVLPLFHYIQILFYFPIHVNFLKHFSYFSLALFFVLHIISINTICSQPKVYIRNLLRINYL